MILAVVRFTSGNTTIDASLTDRGWIVPEAPALGRALDQDRAITGIGPADGDPVTAAANRAAAKTGGQVVFIRPLPSYPPGTVF